MSRKRPATTAPDAEVAEEDDSFRVILALVQRLLQERELLTKHAQHVRDCLVTIDAMQRQQIEAHHRACQRILSATLEQNENARLQALGRAIEGSTAGSQPPVASAAAEGGAASSSSHPPSASVAIDQGVLPMPTEMHAMMAQREQPPPPLGSEHAALPGPAGASATEDDMGMHPVARMTLTAFIITAVIFLEIFACVPNDWIMLTCFLPLLLTPLPLVLMRCCGDGDSLSGGPRGRHWAQFWCSFLFTSTVSMPVLFYATNVVTLKALVLSLSGVLVSVLYVCCSAYASALGDDDGFGFQRW